LVVEVEEGSEEVVKVEVAKVEEGAWVEEVMVLLDPPSLRMELLANMDRDNKKAVSLVLFIISALYGEDYIITSFGR
jgi:hypothetical protein